MNAVLQPLTAPALYLLELTPLCNHRCVGCGNVFVDDRAVRRIDDLNGVLSFAGWRHILDQIAPHAHHIRLTGGEPTLHPDFPAIVEYLRFLNLDFAVLTNGSWRDPDQVLTLLRESPTCTGMLISLHGAHAASHEAFTRVPGSFARALASIRQAVAAGIPVNLSAVLNRANMDEIPAIVALGKSLGMAELVVSRHIGAELPGVSLTPAELTAVVREVDALRQGGEPVKFGPCVPQCLTENSSIGCYAGVAFCDIDSWGNLRPCSHSALKTGNLLEESLQACWLSPAMDTFRQAMAAPCQDCGAYAHCHGGCRAMILDHGVDPLIQPEPVAAPPAPPPLRLHPDWRPVLQAAVREEAWGLVLLHNNKLLAVGREARVFLACLDGRFTLRELVQQFGEAAAAFVGTLAYWQMAVFVERPAPLV